MMFSHTTKGQPYNMGLLSRFLRPAGYLGTPTGIGMSTGNGREVRATVDNEISKGTGLRPRLIDYELLVGEDGKRSVGFGWFAGGSFFSLLSSLSKLIY
jgi:alpha-aminoadipic semialdehyde synthase